MRPVWVELRVRGRLTGRTRAALAPLRSAHAVETTLVVPGGRAALAAALRALEARGRDVVELRPLDVPPPHGP